MSRREAPKGIVRPCGALAGVVENSVATTSAGDRTRHIAVAQIPPYRPARLEHPSETGEDLQGMGYVGFRRRLPPERCSVSVLPSDRGLILIHALSPEGRRSDYRLDAFRWQLIRDVEDV